MNDDSNTMLMAVPKKGRLYEKCMKALEGSGLHYHRANRLDIAYVKQFPVPLKLVFLPAKDIAQFVGEGNVDLGITGQDMVAEADVEVNELMEMGIGNCTLSVQAPVKNNVTDVKTLAGKRIVTSFPHITRKYFEPIDKELGTKTSIKFVSGSVEAACGLGLADAVVDLVETGTTMRAAGLEIVENIMTTQTVLISNPHTKHGDMVAKIKKRLEGYLFAQKYVMMYYNVEKSKHDVILKVTPGRRAPTITPLEDPEWISVGAMVQANAVSKVMDELEGLGAKDIFVVDLINCRT